MATEPILIQEHLPALALRPQTMVKNTLVTEDRSAPYFLRGRNPELAYLGGLIHDMPRSVHAVVGPPGSGKSALLSYLAVYATHHNIDVVQLDQEHFESAELIAKQIDPPQLQAVSRTEGSDEGLDLQLVHAGTSQQTTVSEAVVASMTDAVKNRARRAENGLVILIDEFQNLADDNSQKRSNAKAFLSFMHSTVPSSDRSEETTIPAICIVGGLLNVLDAAHELGLTRLSVGHCFRLGPITPANAKQIIRDHVELEGTDIPPLATVSDSHVERIAQVCEGYPRDLTIAGRETQRMAQKAYASGHTELSNQMVEQIIAASQVQKDELYRSRFTTIRSGREQYILLAVADLAEAWDNRIPTPIVRATITRILTKMGQSANEETTADTTAVLRMLRRRGMLEERVAEDKFLARDNSHGKPEAHFCIPITSFGSYIRERREDIMLEISEPVPYDDLCQPGALDRSPIAEWQWRDEVSTEEVEDIPVTPPTTPGIRERLMRMFNFEA